MPSDKKRINLTVPDELYERIQAYKTRYGIGNDASACLQLIVQQLNGLENTEAMMKLINGYSQEQLLELAKEGYANLKSLPNSQK